MKKKKWKDLQFPKNIYIYSIPYNFQIFIESHARIRKYSTYYTKREAYLNPPEDFLWRLLLFKIPHIETGTTAQQEYLFIEKYFDSEKDLRIYLHTLETNWDNIKMETLL